MLPRDLKAEHFNGYPPEAKELVVSYLGTLQELPITFLPNLLREVIDYDLKFPRERDPLKPLSPDQRKDWLQGFSEISVPAKLEQFNWVGQPAQFVEQLSAY